VSSSFFFKQDQAKVSKGTNTVLNHDILKSKNASIEKLVREELGKLSIQWLQDQFFIEDSDYENSFIQKRKYRNLYEGYTELMYPWYSSSDTKWKYQMVTLATSGSFRTPNFGAKFDGKKFKNRVEYRLYFLLPYSTLYSGDSTDLTLVMDFQVDVKLYDGEEYVDLRFPQSVNEYFRNSGNITIRKRFKNYVDTTYLTFRRTVDQVSVDEEFEKRMTGFSVDWYYEDGTGNRVHVEPDTAHPNAGSYNFGNEQFVQFINYFYKSVVVDKGSIEEIWDTAKNYRLEFIQRGMEINGINGSKGMSIEDTTSCQDYHKIDITEYFEQNTEMAQVMGSPPSTIKKSKKDKTETTLNILPIYKTQINDSMLWLGFQIYHYISSCIDTDAHHIEQYQHIFDVFQMDSPQTILEKAIDNKVNDGSYKGTNQIWQKTSSEKLIEKLDGVLNLEIEKFVALMSPKSELIGNVEKIRDEKLMNQLHNCLQKSQCQGLQELVKNLGDCH
jgi:hypothetical protein